ncbi:PAS domain S-box protein, partial [Helicobacter pylori]|nr:PAS domain S-box protein [Helicobacter pylori]
MLNVHPKLPEAELLAGVLEPMAMLDERGRVLAWNPAAENVFGYNQIEALYQPLSKLTAVPLLAQQLAELTGSIHQVKG